ncbi:hypothetical protein FHL15_009894 [Xylaria flabelliformis]|uniref:Uncharacterized protein n=1 Tax=Xylaria flabelliformis TaxID=2512241 RepID=A0A553HMQ8_9PEZI|nr:hypothetical protein FHL15_009894 [Xylaria flabelliformis]
MAVPNLESSSSVNGPLAGMLPDVWHHIMGQHQGSVQRLSGVAHLNIDPVDWFTQVDLDPCALARSLSSRLLDPRNEQLRNAVHEIKFGCFNKRDVDDMEQRLMALVNSLPNLQRIKTRARLSQDVLRRLNGHSKQLSLYLLGEDGKRTVEGQLHSVLALAATVDSYSQDRGPNKDFLGVQALLFACPNLNSFSLTPLLDYGGCAPRFPAEGTVFSFQFSSDGKPFPPLEDLSLNGYHLSQNEGGHWAEKMQWSKLRSLSLGPQNTTTFLQLAINHATFLRDLTVQVYPDDADGQPLLEEFLINHTSLESLTVKGHYVSSRVVGFHTGLKHLCLHSFEPAEKSQTRPVFCSVQLQELNTSCPYLETLEIDLHRNGTWVRIKLVHQITCINTKVTLSQPEPELKILATKFKNLRRLILHLELGIASVEVQQGPNGLPEESATLIEPVLTEGSAREMGKQFFDWRSLSSSSSWSSKLSLLVLKTGEPLRRVPQWEPAYVQFERRNADTIEIHWPIGPEDAPEVVVLPRDPWSQF